MGEIEKLTPANLLLVLQFVGPGFLIVYFRSMFVTRRQAAFKDNLLFFVFVSVIYAFCVWPFLPSLAILMQAGEYGKWLLWGLLLTVLPSGIGIMAGLSIQRGWNRQAFGWFGLQPISPYPTGWDWAFSQLRGPTYMIVTLDGGNAVAGYFGSDSLAASDLANKDIYLEEIWNLDGDSWKQREVKQGILISGRVIRHIEFIPPKT